MIRNSHCEVRKGTGWEVKSVEEALAIGGGVQMRCTECKGPVRPYKESDTSSAHFEHMSRHNGCSLGDCFSGQKTNHPDAIF